MALRDKRMAESDLEILKNQITVLLKVTMELENNMNMI